MFCTVPSSETGSSSTWRLPDRSIKPDRTSPLCRVVLSISNRGAPARAIQELAGHQDLSTTQRYMHLSPAALDAAIHLLDGGAPHGEEDASLRGGIVEAPGRVG